MLSPFLTSPQQGFDVHFFFRKIQIPIDSFDFKVFSLQQVINVELNREEIVCIVTFLYISQHMFSYFKY